MVKVVIVMDRDKMVYNVYADDNGKVLRHMDYQGNITSNARAKEACMALVHQWNAKTIERHVIENGVETVAGAVTL
ncbi:hypothetical protein [Alicyclobacillus sp. ALC3]|uniref:hypothetical protein n=1 Tax=Alicyclobacillus sp. ALC3 TaxID=2796143 RepID=UPI00237996E0|nr:hypothetical protein [Alicyclobacillus sp. ALC3]WDL99768.1 hypothetical protein JC200_23635 [Alicyclobacillus sp. ALC3]